MKVSACLVVIGLVVACAGGVASAQCWINGDTLAVRGTKNLVVRLENPPKTKVTLSIDRVGGFHHELVWDPAVGDGLKHDVLLTASMEGGPAPGTPGVKDSNDHYQVHAYAEEERLQTQQMVVLLATRFEPGGTSRATWPHRGDLTAKRYITVLSAAPAPSSVPKSVPEEEARAPKLTLECDDDGVEMSKQYLDPRRIYAASVSRGFLDQAAPAVVTDTLALLAEIAVERARSGALELVRERFVAPMCRELTFGTLQLAGGDADPRAPVFPRTCAMLARMRLEDLLSAGRSLVDAARDDIRLTLVPSIIARAKLPGPARDLAGVALQLANRMLDGGGNDLAEIDLLLTQLDRLFQRGLPVNLDAVRRAFVNASQAALGAQKDAVIAEYLAYVLPEDPGRLASGFVTRTPSEEQLAARFAIASHPACVRPKDTPSVFIAADRARCLAALVPVVAALPNWLELAQAALPLDVLIRIIESAPEGARRQFATWLENKDVLAAVPVSDALLQSCAARVTVAIIKWCSGRDSCTAGRIATALDDPRALFKPPSGHDVGDNLCWTLDPDPARRVLRLPADRRAYVELATRALAFLTPAEKGQDRARVQAILHWMFDLAKSVDPGAVEAVDKLEEILALFEKRDYVRAIAQAVTMAETIGGCKDDCSKAVARAVQLIGSVTSYLQVYDETKQADAAEAKAARKKAIESLIDSATDRKGRGRHWVASLGSNVGLATGWTDEVNEDDRHRRFHGVRVPLGLAYQYLPAEPDPKWDGWCSEFRHLWGVQLGLQLADLGQLIQRSDGEAVTWSSFVAPGVEAGLLFGHPDRLLSVTAHASYLPATTGGDPARWQLGFAVSYYVPFLDLN